MKLSTALNLSVFIMGFGIFVVGIWMLFSVPVAMIACGFVLMTMAIQIGGKA